MLKTRIFALNLMNSAGLPRLLPAEKREKLREKIRVMLGGDESASNMASKIEIALYGAISIEES